MTYRSQCGCICHSGAAMMHFAPCCEPDPASADFVHLSADASQKIAEQIGPIVVAAMATLAERCTAIADQVVPEYRAKGARHSGCGSHTAKRWQAAWDGACVALGGKPEDYRR